MTPTQEAQAEIKLWLLRPKEGDDLWEPWYDKAFGFVIRAPEERLARQCAAEDAGDEGKEAWLSSEHSTCTELQSSGEPEMIMRDFAAA